MLRFHILRRDNYTCQYCGAKAPDTALHVDHVVSVFEGGTNDPDNLITACVRCNIGKGTQAAKDESSRPLTQREKQLSRRADWWVESERRNLWALTAFAGECSTTRALMYYLASIADPYGSVGLRLDSIAKRLHLPVADIEVAARGLIAVGYLSIEEWSVDADEALGQIHLGKVRNDETGTHIVLETLCPALPEFFSSVARIYG